MKYIKLFMLLAVVSLFAACSSDDDYNTNETTVSFANNAITTKESAGIVNIPINVTGLRNGDISLRIVTEEVGENPAKEDVNYMITDKTLTLKADTLQSGVINVEVKMVDDNEINENRTHHRKRKRRHDWHQRLYDYHHPRQRRRLLREVLRQVDPERKHRRLNWCEPIQQGCNHLGRNR